MIIDCMLVGMVLVVLEPAGDMGAWWWCQYRMVIVATEIRLVAGGAIVAGRLVIRGRTRSMIAPIAFDE